MYNIEKLLDRPIFWTLVLLIVVVATWGLTRRNKLDYA